MVKEPTCRKIYLNVQSSVHNGNNEKSNKYKKRVIEIWIELKYKVNSNTDKK